MALIRATYQIPWTGPDIQKAAAPGAFIVAWIGDENQGATENDTLEPVFHPDYSEKSIHVVKTAGTMSLNIEGSNLRSGANPVLLKDGNGNNLNFTDSGLAYIQTNVACITPRIVSGTGLTVYIYMLITTIARRQ